MKNLVLLFKPLSVSFLFLLLQTVVLANGEEGQKSIFDLMNHQEVLDLTLETDLTALKADRSDESSYEAKISFKDQDGKKQKWQLKVKLRGAFRRIKCSDVPPLKLNFKKSELEAMGLARYDDLKLVPQCIADDEQAKETLLKEYLAYKLYNDVSPYSFRVQLLRITYKDTATGEKDKQWAFLIEDAAQLRNRLDAEKIESTAFNLPVDSFHITQARTVAMFQYLIGNTDWGFKTGKNLKFLRKKGKLIAVPYDFDFSGLVNASYALPNTNVGQTKLGQRVYLGFEESATDFHGTTYHLLGKREKLEETVMQFKWLSYDDRMAIKAYLDGFFEAPEQVRFTGSVAERSALEADK